MRRTLLAAIGVLALCLSVPGAALAHKGKEHHKGHKGHHHAKTHGKRKAHHASVRFVHFGAATTPTTSTGTGSGTTSGPTTTPTPSTSENAGTVVSYEKGMLKLELSNKSTVEGAVTGNTELKCLKEGSTTPTPSGSSSEPTSADDSGQGDDQSRGDMSQQQGDQQQSSGSDESQGDGSDQSQGDDNGETQTQTQSAPEPVCDTSDLTTGTVVRSAELRISPSGSEFESLVLVLK